MGFFNRDYRCFDGDSIDVAARMESIYSSIYEDTWGSSSTETDTSSTWNNDTLGTNSGMDEW